MIETGVIQPIPFTLVRRGADGKIAGALANARQDIYRHPDWPTGRDIAWRGSLIIPTDTGRSLVQWGRVACASTDGLWRPIAGWAMHYVPVVPDVTEAIHFFKAWPAAGVSVEYNNALGGHLRVAHSLAEPAGFDYLQIVADFEEWSLPEVPEE